MNKSLNKKSERGNLILVVLALFIIFSNNVLAISGSGGGISVSSTIGSVSYQTDSLGSNNYGNGGYDIIGTFNSTSFNGGFGNLNITHNIDTSAPIITLISPSNNSGSLDTTVIFTYNITDDSLFMNNCSLIIDGASKMISIGPDIGINSFNLTNINPTPHTWKVECFDEGNNKGISQTYSFTVIKLTGFDLTNSSNLTNVNITAVPNFTVSKNNQGKIIFNGTTDLSLGGSLDSYITISHNKIIVNSNYLPYLNKSATLTMYNVEYKNIVIKRDGEVCNDCVVKSFNDGTLVFDVPHFSTYTVTSNTKLTTIDLTDNSLKYAGDNITFTANYSNASSGEAINGNCDISFAIDSYTPQAMTFDGTIYSYSRNFSNSSLYLYNVSCNTNNPNFDNLTVSDSATISGASSGFAKLNITIGNSSRFEVTNTPKETESDAGNTTYMALNLTSVTTTWQGYYGNISAQISLGSNDSKILYDWSGVSVNGEIFASRSPNILWDSIDCTTNVAINNEDAYLEKPIDSADSVSNTFNETSHPSFMVSTSTLSNCHSTRLNGPSGKNNNFWNILISDNYGTGNLLYTGIIKQNSQGFTSNSYDFEMIVSAKDNQLTPYYFFMEIE